MPNLLNKSTRAPVKARNITLWDELDLDQSEPIARLDRWNTGRLQRLRTEDLLFYRGDLALKFAGLQDKDPITDRLCLQFGADSSGVLDEEMRKCMLSNCPFCCSYIPDRVAKVLIDRRFTQVGFFSDIADFGEQFHIIREGPYLRWKEKDTSEENRLGKCETVFEAGRNVVIVTMLSWFLCADLGGSKRAST